MNFIKLYIHVCVSVFAGFIFICQAMENRVNGPVVFTDLPNNLQIRILLEGKPELEQWLYENDRTPKKLEGHTSSVIGTVITPDQKKVITGSDDKTAIIWDLQTGELLKQLKGHHLSITCLRITFKGDKVITGSYDKTAIIWDVKTGNILLELKGHTSQINCLAITLDDKKVITGSKDETAIIWDINTGIQCKKLQGHNHSINHLAITPDGEKVVTGSGDKTAVIWDVNTGTKLHILRGHCSPVDYIEIFDDGKRFVSGSYYDSAIIWDIGTGKQVQTFQGHTKWISCFSMTPNNDLIICLNDGTAHMLNIKTGKLLKETKVDFPRRYVALAPEKERTVFGLDDGTVLMWDMKKNIQSKMPALHTDSITCIKVTSDGNKVITGSRDKTATIFNLCHEHLYAEIENLSSRQLRIAELALLGAKNGRKIRLPRSLKEDLDTLPPLIKNIIQKFVL